MNDPILGRFRAQASKPKLSIIYIVEPPEYEKLACYLAASIRENFDDDIQLIGYCPEHRFDDLDPKVLEVQRRLGAETRTFRANGMFEPAYPHGNKILACLEKRDTEFTMFVDSDVAFIAPNSINNLIMDNHVSLTPAASMTWAEQSIWDDIYAAFDMEIPAQRIQLMRRRHQVIPYFSSGLMAFPEQPLPVTGKRFPEVWMETAKKIDAIDGLERKRPYLDQMSLPVAIQRTGLNWNLLPEEQHFILGGQLRHKPFPVEREIFTVHYRGWRILKDAGLTGYMKNTLHAQVGVKKIEHIEVTD